jgi:DNA modification methylase
MVHHGDLFDVLPTLEAESVDACVTDPPYGINFMGKAWDGKAIQELYENREAAMVKRGGRHDGGLKGSIGSPGAAAGTYDRSATANVAFQQFSADWGREVLRVLKPGAYLLVFGGTRTYHRLTSGIEDAGFEIRDCLSWLYGSGFPKSLNLPGGLGTALKPSWEPCVLARKPIKGTVTQNVYAHGTGALNVDACRIAGETNPAKWGGRQLSDIGYQGNGQPDYRTQQHDAGRWPPNVLLDDVAAAMLDEQTGERPTGGDVHEYERVSRHYYEGGWPERNTSTFTRDTGGASRFYYVAKPSREERDMGCYDLPARSGGDATDREDGSAGTNSPRAGAGRTGGARNIHPTVKPVELMRWLVRLVTPPDGLVLDPFTGSGTTGMACRYELRRFIGIEREAEYVAIAERRIATVAPLFGEAAS